MKLHGLQIQVLKMINVTAYGPLEELNSKRYREYLTLSCMYFLE